MDRLSKYNECVNDYDLLSYFDYPKVIAHEIILYMYATCSECKKCLLIEYTCEYCNTKRCKYHQYMTVYSNDIVKCTDEYCISPNNCKQSFLCIYTKCAKAAYFGYKDIICYCIDHIKDK